MNIWTSVYFIYALLFFCFNAGSGEIDFDEFLGMMVSLLGLDEPDDAKDAFKCLDNNQSGKRCLLQIDLKLWKLYL